NGTRRSVPTHETPSHDAFALSAHIGTCMSPSNPTHTIGGSPRTYKSPAFPPAVTYSHSLQVHDTSGVEAMRSGRANIEQTLGNTGRCRELWVGARDGIRNGWVV